MSRSNSERADSVMGSIIVNAPVEYRQWHQMRDRIERALDDACASRDADLAAIRRALGVAEDAPAEEAVCAALLLRGEVNAARAKTKPTELPQCGWPDCKEKIDPRWFARVNGETVAACDGHGGLSCEKP